MKIAGNSLRWCFVCMLLTCSMAYAQSSSKILRIRDLDGEELPTPEYSVKNAPRGQAKTREWFRVQAEYDTAPEWVDELSVTFYVLLKDETVRQGSPYVLLRGQQTYVNIEEGNGHLCEAYLHPSTLKRYKGNVERIAIVFTHNGRLVAMESNPESKARWWEQLAPQDGLLLNRMQTPFAMINFDDYEAVKVNARR